MSLSLFTIQVVSAANGNWIFNKCIAMNTHDFKTNRKLQILIVVLLSVAFLGFNLWSSYLRHRKQASDEAAKSAHHDRVVQQLVSSEELLLELTPRLRPLSTSVLNLQLPDSNGTGVFADQVELSDSIELADKTPSAQTGSFRRRWTIQPKTESVDSNDLQLWQVFLAETKYWENAGFYFIRGEFHPDSLDEFNSLIGFDGLAIYRDGSQSGIHIEMAVTWARRSTTENPSEWKITAWKHVVLKALDSPGPLFRDVLKDALPDRALFQRATVSRHSQITADVLAGKDYFLPVGETYPFFFPDVTLEHPGVAVVDIDDDGFDDLYIAMQHGNNLLLRNIGNGTFEEVAAEFGLDFADDSTSAIFADFDNDGDADLFLGRARHRSRYLVNDQGRFVDQSSQKINCELPALVSSISSADYNGDGLLDIYFSTYSPIEESNRFAEQSLPLWLEHFMSKAQAAEFQKRNLGAHRFTNRSGPPNLLLKNVGGGKFELAKESTQLELWRMSFQASWSDFDGDGDPDVYVANDYAPDNLLRNDGAGGFTDITIEAGLTGMGFGMGVSWDDYDNDGQADIYVSNMYSKAGQRILSQISDIDPRIREMAGGNFLYRGDHGKFSMVSGSADSDMKVAKAGWSWGGQFFDFDNDGFRDIYALSGYYTAPANVAIDLDL